jgi:uncharacterized protein YxeA
MIATMRTVLFISLFLIIGNISSNFTIFAQEVNDNTNSYFVSTNANANANANANMSDSNNNITSATILIISIWKER